MRALLDTQVLLWWMSGDPRLGEHASDAITDMRNDIMVSAASAFEIATKQVIGKLEAPEDLDRQIDELGFTELPVTVAHCLEVRKLPLHHKDPFDRLLVAQARHEDLTLITVDLVLRRYEVRTMAADG